MNNIVLILQISQWDELNRIVNRITGVRIFYFCNIKIERLRKKEKKVVIYNPSIFFLSVVASIRNKNRSKEVQLIRRLGLG